MYVTGQLISGCKDMFFITLLNHIPKFNTVQSCMYSNECRCTCTYTHRRHDMYCYCAHVYMYVHYYTSCHVLSELDDKVLGNPSYSNFVETDVTLKQ